MSSSVEIFAYVFRYVLMGISFSIYIFIILANAVSKEKLTVYNFFKLQTLIFSIIYSIGNFNFGFNKFLCELMGNIRNISFMTIISIQTLILVFIYISLQYQSYTETNLKTIYKWLYVIPHLSWLIMIGLSFTGDYTQNPQVGLCKYNSRITTYYRTILYVLHAIVCVVLFVLTIRAIKTSQVNTNIISIYVKSFVLYFTVLFFYLLSYLTITVLMVLETEIELYAGFDSSESKYVWFIRVIAQTIAPIIVCCLNCLSKGKVVNLLKKTCGNKCETLLLTETTSFKELAKGSTISMKMVENENEVDNEIEIESSHA